MIIEGGPRDDRFAALTREPDTSLDDLRRLVGSDDEVRVPKVLFNSLLNRSEPV